MRLFHTHKFGKIENNFQCCEKCGYIIRIPCQHKWKVFNSFIQENTFSHNQTATIYLLQCEICGDMKQEKIGI